MKGTDMGGKQRFSWGLVLGVAVGMLLYKVVFG